jgi:hypothetical protein
MKLNVRVTRSCWSSKEKRFLGSDEFLIRPKHYEWSLVWS